MTAYEPGTFCWVDLATNAPAAAKGFYGEILGWSAADVETQYEVPYSLLLRDGQRAAALYEMAPEQGAFPYWAAYVRVTDIEASVRRATELGGRLVMPAVELMDLARMAYVQDPTGAVLGLWEPRTLFGAELDNTEGARSWCELQTRDTSAATRFYEGLFGWRTRTSRSLMDGRYTLFEQDGREVGGMIELDAEWGTMPPNWSIYFGVEDCDAAVAKAKQLGGSLVMDAQEVAGVGRFAFLADPQGAIFAIIQFGH
ncbi:VOC family protein [Thiocapsa imhoffii]|nr:VOC family protein [Thiocapsa imhoffii]